MGRPRRVNYVCPACGETVEAPASLAGRGADCPDCGEHIAAWPDPVPGGPAGDPFDFGDDEPAPRKSGADRVSPRGRSIRSRITTGLEVFFAIVLVLAVIAFIGGRSGGDRVTMAEYNRVEVGMTVDQVDGVVGFGGREVSYARVGGVPAAVYEWRNPDGSGMVATFENGQLIAVAQDGLR